jgi:hypothetical protein
MPSGPVNGGGVPYKEIKPYNRVTGRRRKLLKEMETDSVYGRLIDRGPIDKIIFKDGDLDQLLLMNMDMEYLLFSWRPKPN